MFLVETSVSLLSFAFLIIVFFSLALFSRTHFSSRSGSFLREAGRARGGLEVPAGALALPAPHATAGGAEGGTPLGFPSSGREERDNCALSSR